MTTTNSDLGTHPIVAVVARFHDDLDHLDTRLWSLTDAELAQVLPSLSRLRTRITELELQAAHEADNIGLGTEVGAADTGAFWANSTRQSKPITKWRLKLAAALDRHETTRTAMAAGRVAEDQAAVIIKAVEELSTSRAEAETELVRLAAFHDAKELALLAKRILEVVAPEIAEEHLRQALEREEQAAQDNCRLTITDDGHGRSTIRGRVPTRVAAILKKSVLAINNPKHRFHTTTPAGLGHAFCEYIERYPINKLPKAGGVDATIVVTMTLEAFLGDSQQPATLDTGDLITAGQARRLACEAGIIPIVLGNKSEVLDLGRSRRFHSKAQRIAIAHRDHTCTALGCDWPAALCHVHTTSPGPEADRRPFTTDGSSAPDTTPTPTHRPTR